MIEIKNLYKCFGAHLVLRGVNLTIERGKTTVIIGRSGCGKSVLLKHIIGLLKPDKGTILIDNQDITEFDERKLNELRLKMSMVFQSAALFDSLTVADNVGFTFIEHHQMERTEVIKHVRESLAMVGLSGIHDLMPLELSGGMKKRVALARAICIKPEIILYDEPTTGVDPITADIINELIKSLHDKLKVTSVAVTHDMKSAYRIADRIAMLYGGKIIAYGTPDEIRNTSDPTVHQFINGLSIGPITDALVKSI